MSKVLVLLALRFEQNQPKADTRKVEYVIVTPLCGPTSSGNKRHLKFSLGSSLFVWLLFFDFPLLFCVCKGGGGGCLEGGPPTAWSPKP